MSSFSLFLLSLLLFISLSVASSSYTYQQLTACHFAEDNCAQCWNQCPTVRNPFFGSTRDISTHEHLVLSLQECLRETTYYRQWLPNWCVSNKTAFYRTEEFPVNEDNCLLQPYACSQHIEKTAILTKEAIRFGRYRLSLNIGELGRIQRNLTVETKQFVERKKKMEKVKKAWNEKWLEQVTFHLNNLNENVTRFADPVLYNYHNLLKENQQLDFEISKTDLVSATVENKFVRRDTVEKIPGVVRSIHALKNQIHSKKNETDSYLNEIKVLASKTALLQEKATNIIYETTHAKQLDGEIVLLDNELLDLYIELKKERSNLRILNVRTTFSKLRLVAIMRMTIQQITRQQIRKGCSASQVMGL